jgi:hypothetical protein
LAANYSTPFFALNGSVARKNVLRNVLQALITAVIVEVEHPLPELLAIKAKHLVPGMGGFAVRFQEHS